MLMKDRATTFGVRVQKVQQWGCAMTREYSVFHMFGSPEILIMGSLPQIALANKGAPLEELGIVYVHLTCLQGPAISIIFGSRNLS